MVVSMKQISPLSDVEVENIWAELTDIPFNENKQSHNELVLAQDYFIWKKGTTRDDIWHWFDKHYSLGIHYLLYNY